MKGVLNLFLLLFSLIIFNSQTDGLWAQEPKNKHYEKASAERKKNAKEAEKELIEQHEKIQSKSTRKMMKENKKKSKRLKKGQQPMPFYKKWFIKNG
jgi:hypothetical protein